MQTPSPATRRQARFSSVLTAILALGIFTNTSIQNFLSAQTGAEPNLSTTTEPSTLSQSSTIQTGTGNTLRAQVKLGASTKFSIRFEFSDGTNEALLAKLQSEQFVPAQDKASKEPARVEVMPDAFLAISGMGLQFHSHIRPRLKRYTPEQAADIARRWNTLPRASEHWTSFEVRITSTGAELWLDGRFCGNLPRGRSLRALTVQSEAGAEVRGLESATVTTEGRYLALDISQIRRPGALKNSESSLSSGPQIIGGIPLIVAAGSQQADIGATREMQGPRLMETNENTSRTSLDGMPESLLFSVPQKFYTRVWVLCAAEDDPAKDAVFTARLTRFAVSGRGGAMADTLVKIPRGHESRPKDMREVGSVSYTAADGSNKLVPLFLVPVELKVGEILDLLQEESDPFAAMKIGPYLDLEFLGKCGGLEVQNDHRRRPLKNSTSAVHIFGATLEVSGVEMFLRQSQPGNIFHNDESPQTGFVLRANEPGTYQFLQEITDASGKLLSTTKTPVPLTKTGAEREITGILSMPDPGWYGLSVKILDDKNRALFEHKGAFALLGSDTRSAGYESPFGTWWFGGAHYTTKDLRVVGPLLFKAGLRRVPVGWTKDTEAEMAPWKLTLNQISWPFRLADLDNWIAAEERVEKLVREKLARFPHCLYVDIFHESFDNVLPPELYGGTYEPKQPEKEEKLFNLALKGARFFRKKFPELKLIVGNSGGSAGTVAMLLRRGFPRELIDYLGSETTGQTICPEKLSVHTTAGIWILKETARKFGYNIPLTGCYEFTCRAERDLSPRTQAEWYTRDFLFGLAHRFATISPGEIEDVGNAYYDSFYGAAGICQRRGLLYPKPAYVAIATLTKVLDGAELLQQVPTGSSSAHLVEFQQGERFVYASCTARGECDMELIFPKGSDIEAVEFLGKRTRMSASDGCFRATSSPAVSYFISNVRLRDCRLGERRFDQNTMATRACVIAGKNDLSNWTLGSEESRVTTPTLRHGKFSVRPVNDPERGVCLELELHREGNLPEIVGEYASLRLKEPLPVPGDPHTLGIWIKGDSSWGRVYWELEDATGESWISNGGYEGGDWGNQAAIDFDGWCYLTFPISQESPAIHLEPGRGLGLWKGSSDGRLNLPLKLTGLYIETHRQSLNLTEMRPVSQRIRIQEVSALIK